MLLNCVQPLENVLHEFSAISGVKDDMSDIIQNLKGVRFRLSDSDVDNVNISLKGKKYFTAAEIQKATDQFEVLKRITILLNLIQRELFKWSLELG